jgi:hypothetical protein
MIWHLPLLGAWSEIRAVRRVVKQLSVHMLECEQPYANMHWNGGALHQMSAFLCSEWSYSYFIVSPYIFDVILWIHNEHSFSIPKAICYQLSDRRFLKLFWLFGECAYIHCSNCSLVLIFTNEIQISSPVTDNMWLRHSSPSLWNCSKKSKQKLVSAFCVHPWAFSELAIAYPNCDNLVENSGWNLWKFTWKLVENICLTCF